MDRQTKKTSCHTADFAPVGTAALREIIRKRWPQALKPVAETAPAFSTGLPELDALFPLRGIPYGQLIEITGGVSSGKTSLLLKLLAHLTRTGVAAYIDFSSTFFPSAAAVSGVDLTRLLVVKPDSRPTDRVKTGLRTAELLLRNQTVNVIVFDLVGEKQVLPIVLLHRLRLKTVRARALTIFLTENNSEIIPSSMASLRLEVLRSGSDRLKVHLTKSRICREGTQAEVLL